MPRRPAIALLLFAGWTFIGYYFATQAHYGPAHYPWSYALGINLTYYYLWTLTTPIVIAIARRYRFESGRWGIALFVHMLASVVLTAVQIIAGEAILNILRVRSMPSFATR